MRRARANRGRREARKNFFSYCKQNLSSLAAVLVAVAAAAAAVVVVVVTSAESSRFSPRPRWRLIHRETLVSCIESFRQPHLKIYLTSAQTTTTENPSRDRWWRSRPRRQRSNPGSITSPSAKDLETVSPMSSQGLHSRQYTVRARFKTRGAREVPEGEDERPPHEKRRVPP